jgi:hypothetical protein
VLIPNGDLALAHEIEQRLDHSGHTEATAILPRDTTQDYSNDLSLSVLCNITSSYPEEATSALQPHPFGAAANQVVLG